MPDKFHSWVKKQTLRMEDGGSIGSNIGPYWSKSNADFNATDPNFAQRVLRQVNPVTGLGSIVGQFHDNVSNGNFGQAGLDAMAAVNPLPFMKGAVNPLVKAGVSDATESLAGAGLGAVQNAAETSSAARQVSNPWGSTGAYVDSADKNGLSVPLKLRLQSWLPGQ